MAANDPKRTFAWHTERDVFLRFCQRITDKLVLRFSSLLIFIVAISSASAAPPALPDFVETWLYQSNLDYELPHGQFESSLRTYLEREGQAEPWAITGDFNGDGSVDWAGILRNRNERIDLVAIISTGSTYTNWVLTPLGLDGDDLITGVVVKSPGAVTGFPIEDDEPAPVVTLTNPGIHLFYFEKASVLYYWREDSFLELVTSD